MKVLYLIFSHDHQPQVARLALIIRRLSPDAEIAIHHDPQLAPFDASLLRDEWRVRLIPDPVRAVWGGFSQVEQYLHAFRWSLSHLEFDWVITLSGFTYPIHPLEGFEAMLASSGMDAFVYHFDAYDPNHWPIGTAATRLQFHYFKFPKFRYWHRVPAPVRAGLQRLRVWLNAHQSLIRIVPRPRGVSTQLGIRRLRRPFGGRLKLQGGRQFLNLNVKALRVLLRFVDLNPEWTAYMRTCLNSDETFFTTILANAPHLSIDNDVQRFIRWPRGVQHAASGAVITADEIPEVLQSAAPFARKLDSRIDARALIWLLSVKWASPILCNCRCEQEPVAGRGTRRSLRLPPVKDVRRLFMLIFEGWVPQDRFTSRGCLRSRD